MIRGTDRSLRPGGRALPAAVLTAALVAAGCGASNRPPAAAADPGPRPPTITAAVKIAATAPFDPVPCPVARGWVECGLVSAVDTGPTSSSAPSNPLGGTFVVVVHNPDAPGTRTQRDAALAAIDAKRAEEKATIARIAPSGGDLLPALEPALRIVQLDQEQAAIAASS